MAKQRRRTEAEKLFIVHRLACFDSPSQVSKAYAEAFPGLVLTPQHAELYDPTKATGKGLGEKLTAIFHETRKAFLEDTASVGVSHQAVRLRVLDRMAAKAESQGNLALAAQLLEQAAKEMGEAYTNKRRLEHSVPDELDDDQLAERASRLFDAARARRASSDPAPGAMAPASGASD